MAKQLQQIDITNTPELLRLAEEVRVSRVPRLLTRGDQAVAVLAPVHGLPAAPRSARRDRRTGPDDPLWSIIGIGLAAEPDDGVTDVSENTDTYLAQAYADLHE